VPDWRSYEMKNGRAPVRRMEEPEGWYAALVMGSSGTWSVCSRGLSVPSICSCASGRVDDD
jgi:hypothetical protein